MLTRAWLLPILGSQKCRFTAARGSRRRAWISCRAETFKGRVTLPSPWTRLTLTSSYGTYAFKRSLLMSQFEKIKKQYEEYLLLFQVGDFYELYGDDAMDVASKTSLRATRKNGIPMAGFPVRSLETWQRTLVEAGFQLAICKQIQPSSNGSKLRLLGREVVKLVTPGTLTEPLDQQANYLMSITTGPTTTLGLAWIDISTSDFQVSSSEVENVDEDLERICPSEVLLSEALVAAVQQGASYNHQQQHPATEGLLKSPLLKECHLTPIPDSWYSEEEKEGSSRNEQLLKLFGSLKTGEFSTLEISAASALLHFVIHTQRSVIPFLSPPSRFSHHQHMAIDANTRRALEIVSPLHSNPKKATLLGCIDRTVTAAGARLLRERLSSPLTDIQAIKSRLATVELFFTQLFHSEALVNLLKSCSDLERIIQKIATGSAACLDLQAVKNTLKIAGDVQEYIKTIPNSECLAEDMQNLQSYPLLVEELEKAIGGGKYGDVISKGYSSKVDSLREEIRVNEREVSKLVNRLRNDSGAMKLAAAPHKSYGRVLEAPRGQVSIADRCKELVRVDETQGKKRYTHIELQRLNAEMLELDTKYSDAQEQLFQELCNKVMSQAQEIVQTAKALARLDVSTSLGLMAADREYCKPKVTGDPVFSVIGGAHPVVATLQKGGFVSNNCSMDEQRLWIVTGPNMGGKSTFLRQNALIAILAQMGSFVPAKEATIGVVDRLFARVGASDNVARHMSTFHMEMTETANILINATPRSFIILDEVGRGTATSEGLSIAQAVAEHLHNKIDCRVLLATHFHQLAALAQWLPNAGCYKLIAERSHSGIVFTYKIMPGQADHSFGIDVAQLAGIPLDVIHRAQQLLEENNSVESVLTGMTSSLSDCTPTPENDTQEHSAQMQTQRRCIRKLQELSLDHITPIEALNFLAEVKQLLQSNTKDNIILPMQHGT